MELLITLVSAKGTYWTSLSNELGLVALNKHNMVGQGRLPENLLTALTYINVILLDVNNQQGMLTKFKWAALP